MRAERARAVGRWVAFGAAWLGMALNGAIFSFDLYSNSMKATFNLTQSEVGNMASVMTMGFNNGIIPALVSRYVGLPFLSVIGLFLTSPGYFLVWSAFSMKSFYSQYSGLLVLYHAMIGLGASFVFMACLLAVTSNTSSRHRGKAIGLLEATMVGVSPAVLSAVYSAVFSHGIYSQPELQNASGFVLLLAIGSGSAYAICVLFLRSFPSEEEESQHRLSVSSTSSDDYQSFDEQIVIVANINNKAKDRVYLHPATDIETAPLLPKSIYNYKHRKWSRFQRFKKLTAFLFTGKFQCLMWSFGFIAGAVPMFANSIPVILASGSMTHFQPVLTTVYPLSAVVSSMAASTASDFLIDRCPRAAFVLLYSIFFTVSSLLMAFLSTNIVVVMVTTVVFGCSTGFVWALVVPMVGEQLGAEDFGRNWGVITFCCAVVNYFSQDVFNYFYDLRADKQRNCMGVVCYQPTFLILTGLGCISAALLAILLMKYSKKTK